MNACVCVCVCVCVTKCGHILQPRPLININSHGNIKLILIVLTLISTCLNEALPPPSVFLQDYVQAMTGLCYDGLEGLIYLLFFSFVTALMFTSIICSVPHTWHSKG